MDSGYWGNSKPPAGVPLERSALTNGLVGRWTMCERYGAMSANLVGEGVPFRATNAAAMLKPAAGVPCFSIPAGTLVTTDASSLFDIPGSRTLMVQVNVTTATDTFDEFFDTQSVAGTNTDQYNIFWQGGQTPAAYPGTEFSSGVSLNLNQWYWLALVVDMTAGGISWWINGTMTATTALSWPATGGTTLLRIGGRAAGVSVSNGLLVGDVLLYRRTLAPQEIRSITQTPYAMFAAPVWRRYFIPQAAPPATTTAGYRALLGVGI